MREKIEEIIFHKHCGIDLTNLTEQQLIDPDKVSISPNVHDRIFAAIQEEYPGLSKLQINLILLQYGAHVDESLDNNEVELEAGYIKEKKGDD